MNLGATAIEPAGGSPFAFVAIDVSMDGGNTWNRIVFDGHPSSPFDSESVAYSFAAGGAAVVRATAADRRGLMGTALQALAISRASQPGVSIAPAQATITAGQGVTFTASGGASGNYAWGGSAAGNGASASATFLAAGTYTVTLVDTGNSSYSPSAAASATVTVQTAFYTLSLSASPGGSVYGGGSYPPGSQATAVAAAAPGNAFAGWAGDLVGATPTILVAMNSNKSLIASFVPLLAQTISVVTPSSVSTRTPPFTLSAQSSSGLPVALTLDSGPVTLAANLVTPTGSTGTATLTATQPGNSQYLPAPPVVITFPIGAPPAGVVIADDSSKTKRSDRATWVTSYTSNPSR